MVWMAPAPPASQCAIMQLSLMTANERNHPHASELALIWVIKLIGDHVIRAVQ